MPLVAAPAGAKTLATAIAATPARRIWRRFKGLSGLGWRRSLSRSCGRRRRLIRRRGRRSLGLGWSGLARGSLLGRANRSGLGRRFGLGGRSARRGRRVGLSSGVLRQGLRSSEAVSQRFRQFLGVAGGHLADDGGERAFLHLGRDRQT